LKVLVTGASSGIGRALALKLAEQGSEILATARRQTMLEELTRDFEARSSSKKIGKIIPVAGDITDPDHRLQLAERCNQIWGGLDVLINNAGAGAIGSFDLAKPDRLRQVMELDFFAPVELTRLMLPLLRCGTRPAILNIGSVLSHRAVPLKSEYCAAKFAFRGWSEAIRCELANESIEVLHLSPSTTRSEFFQSLVDTDPEVESRSLGSMSPEQVAEAAIRSLVRSKRESILSLGGKSLVWANRFFPGLLDRILAKSSIKNESTR
jgi:short-subunit dehydrogenase